MSEAQPIKVYVIMGNDYPCRVYADKEAANKYVVDMNEESKRMSGGGHHCKRIYYRSYEFEVRR